TLARPNTALAAPLVYLTMDHAYSREAAETRDALTISRLAPLLPSRSAAIACQPVLLGPFTEYDEDIGRGIDLALVPQLSGDPRETGRERLEASQHEIALLQRDRPGARTERIELRGKPFDRNAAWRQQSRCELHQAAEVFAVVPNRGGHSSQDARLGTLRV